MSLAEEQATQTVLGYRGCAEGATLAATIDSALMRGRMGTAYWRTESYAVASARDPHVFSVVVTYRVSGVPKLREGKYEFTYDARTGAVGAKNQASASFLRGVRRESGPPPRCNPVTSPD